MAKTIHFDDDNDTITRILDYYEELGYANNGAFRDFVESELVTKISTSGAGTVTDTSELTNWLASIIQQAIEEPPPERP
jgi:hypothetical protein